MLNAYKKKRNFKETTEPKGVKRKSKASSRKGYSFVVQKHAATRLHYDFRLEIEGVLKSWAVPKGPSLNPEDKRLAIMVEDHPFEYRDFEGVIPEGNYGAGTVMVWDTGYYYPVDINHEITDKNNLPEGLHNGAITFFLEGEKLKGLFSLIHLKNRPEPNQWLLIKLKDPYVSTQDVLKQDRSALTNRSMEEITEEKEPKTHITEKKKTKLSPKTNSKGKMPHHIHPMLAHLVDEPFDDENWLFEVKWDGFRAIAEVDRNHVELYSRSFQSFNRQFSPIVDSLKHLSLQAVLDGEIVILDKKGRSSFQSLQNFQNTGKGDLRYYVFDLLYYNGEDLRNVPLIQRKQLLKKILPNNPTSLIQYSDHVLKKGKEIFEQAKKNQLEGIIAKEINSSYLSKRSRSWLKIKTHQRQEAVICGFTAPRGGREKFGALILGIKEKGGWKYVGHVGGGFDRTTLTNVLDHLKPLITDKSPFKEQIKTNMPVTWVKPELICEVSFSEWTEGDHMRQPIFLGLREDKKSKEVKRETPIVVISTKAKSPFTNLDKVYWPDEGYTKGDLINYYKSISKFILPYLKDRPESLRRYPKGIQEQGFFQKNIDESFPSWVPTYEIIHEGNRKVNYLLIPDEKTLLFTINLGCIDLNPFNSRIQKLDYPDYLILDLDPENISFDAVIETAQVIHDLLQSHNIPSYCKTSGARGLHIYIPLGAKYTYEQARQFAQILASLTHQQLPKITSIERKPSARQKRVYIDFLQNNFGQTLAAPYSVRAKPGATVSTPLEWSEVKPGLNPRDFTMENTLARLKQKGDLFKPVLGRGINLKSVLKHLL